jgi:hypothetical protein
VGYYRESFAGAALGVVVAIVLTCLIGALMPNIPGDNGGSMMALGFCGFPILAVIGASTGVYRVRRKMRLYFEDRPGQLPTKPRQRPYQRRDGSF